MSRIVRKLVRRGLPIRWLRYCVAVGDRTVGCWVWPFGRDGKGYGRVLHDGLVLAHQVALVLDGRPRPAAPNDCALHSCDNPPCVNPSHLRWGSRGDNVREAETRGLMNHPRGEAHGRSRLTDEQVKLIRQSDATHSELAERFGVGKTTVGHVLQGRTWRHI